MPLSSVNRQGDTAAITLDAYAAHILVVEDEPAIAQLLAMMLQRAGYRVDIAHTAAQALQRLAEADYAAMTLDLMLPDMNGMEVIRRVRGQPAMEHLPIIVVSAKMEDGRLAIDGEFSDIDWLPKPFSEQKLMAAVAKNLPADHALRPHVLHVEDDVDLHNIVVGMAGNRYDFELAATLTEAREMLALERFDMVILDLQLPDGSGWDLLPTLRALEPTPRIIILSGTEITAAEASKVESVLRKSQISPLQLLAALSARINTSQ